MAVRLLRCNLFEFDTTCLKFGQAAGVGHGHATGNQKLRVAILDLDYAAQVSED